MTVTSDTNPLVDAAAALHDDVVAVRREIHRHPELGLALPHTQSVVLDALSGLDVSVRTGSGESTWVIADLHGGLGDGPAVLLRADMDALPLHEDTGLEFTSEHADRMHACGHDAHTAMLVGALRLLHDRRETFAGTIRFMFQPGEEGHAGALGMIGDGVLHDPPVVGAFAIHVTPNIPTGVVASRAGTLLAAADEIYATIRGRGGHASQPHLSNDPIPVLCEAVGALQTLVTRRVDIFHPAVLTIASIHAGTTTNVIPESASLEGTIRTTSRATREAMHDGVVRVIEGIAAAHDMEAEVEVRTGYPVTANDPAFVARVEHVVGETLGLGRWVTMPSPTMGAEDFSFVLEHVPGAMVFLGACPPDTSFVDAPSCHSNLMTIDERAMTSGVALHAAMALDMLASPPAAHPGG
jgi:amidohydrolase